MRYKADTIGENMSAPRKSNNTMLTSSAIAAIRQHRALCVSGASLGMVKGLKDIVVDDLTKSEC